MKSQQTYQAFIEGELGRGFTEHDFVAYMENSGAHCARDPDAQVMYCRYMTFGTTADRTVYRKSTHALTCGASGPFHRLDTQEWITIGLGSGGARDFPSQSDADFSQRHHIPSCKALFHKQTELRK